MPLNPLCNKAELKGKNIANTTGFSSEIVAVHAFKEHGLSFFKDVVRLAAVLDYIKRVDQSFDWANAHPEQLGEIMAKVFKTDAAPLQRYMKWSGSSYGIPVDTAMINGLQATYDLEAEIGRLPKGKSVRPYFTEAFNPYFK